MSRPISVYDQIQRKTAVTSTSTSSLNGSGNQQNQVQEESTSLRPSVAALSKLFDKEKQQLQSQEQNRTLSSSHRVQQFAKSHSIDAFPQSGRTEGIRSQHQSPQLTRPAWSKSPQHMHPQRGLSTSSSNLVTTSRDPPMIPPPTRNFSSGSLPNPSNTLLSSEERQPISVSRLSQIFEQQQLSALDASIAQTDILKKGLVVSPTKQKTESLGKSLARQSVLPPPKPRKPVFLNVPHNDLESRGRTQSSPVLFSSSGQNPTTREIGKPVLPSYEDVPPENPFETPLSLVSKNDSTRTSLDSLSDIGNGESPRATIVIPRGSVSSTITIVPNPSSLNKQPEDSRKISRAPPPLAARPNYSRQGSIPSGLRNLAISQEDLSGLPSPGSIQKSSSAQSIGNAEQRVKVIEEIVETERSFLSDMRVLDEVYVQPKGLADADHKLLFQNLPKIIDVSQRLLSLLEAGSSDDLRIGSIFNEMFSDIETSYCNYCKNNDASLAKLAEYASPHCPESTKTFLENCRQKLTGRTGAWDLGSLIVKPVQRVLKYPLLLKSLLKQTPASEPDYESLVQALCTAEMVAEKINEVKKRVDIVEKYVGGKAPTNVMHGITKKWARGTQQLMKATGLAENGMEDDAFYDALIERFEEFNKSIHQLKADTLMWIKALRDFIETEEGFAASMAEIYFLDTQHKVQASGNDYPALVKKYFKAASRLMGGPWKDADSRIKSSFIPLLDAIAARFREPSIIIKKHDAKKLDYERLNAILAKNEQADKALVESADAYKAIHAQILEELPQFLALVGEYIQYSTVVLVNIQAEFYTEMKNMYLITASTLVHPTESTVDIIPQFMSKWRSGSIIERTCRDLGLLRAWRNEVWDTSGNYMVSSTSFEEPDTARRIPSLSRHNTKESKQTSSPPSLIDLHGSAPPPRPILSQTESDSILRNKILVSHQKTLQPTRAPSQTFSSTNSSPIILTRNRAQTEKHATQPLPFESPIDRVKTYTGGSISRSSSVASDIFDDERAIPDIQIHSTQSSPRANDILTTPSLSSIPVSLSQSTESMPDIEEVRRQRGLNQARVPPFLAIAMYAFEAEMEDEIHLLAGSDIQVLQIGGRNGIQSDDWWFGRIVDTRITGKGGRTEGWFPGAYVMPV